jgi:hypothetical protein
MKARRYFCWEEANALVPRLTEIFGTAGQLRGQLRATYEELQRLGVEPSAEDAGTGTGDSPEVARLRARFQGLYEALAAELQQVVELGAEIKDLDSGLVDFWYQREGRDVLLCWRYGEEEVGHWHDPEAGFAGRKPIDLKDRNRRRMLH